MAIAHHKITEAAYIDLVFANPGRQLELYDGPETMFITDLFVVPIAYVHEFQGRPGVLAIFRDPTHFVAVWSASTGDHDINAKLPVSM